MVITELAYKFEPKDTFTPIIIQGHSGSFEEKPQEADPGILYYTEIKAYIPGISSENDLLLTNLMARPAIYMAVDSAGLQYQIGDNIAKASLTYTKVNEGKPGSKHGYNITITLKYSKPAKMQVL
jgi:hypothetical protein